MDKALRDALAQAEDRHWWFEGRRRILAGILRGLEVRGPLLEVGCGNGANLDMLADFGPVTGVEPDPQDRARAGARRTAEVVDGALPDLPVEPGRYGAVLALDVIEHIEDDEAAVRGLARACRADGVVVVTVPAGPWLWSAHDTRNGHFRRYTRRTLRQVLEAGGLHVQRISAFNMWLLPLVAVVRVLGRFVGQDHAGTGLPAHRINRMLMKLLASESRLLARFDLPAGVSLLAVARPIPPDLHS
ncbi:MAG: class I SAM-dependent methyltransferase [Rhodothermales bacterium]|nr:class I SAM-dependent methyltransferase [Rhodothermales bacterium]MBO6779088.1 class I SAM-dependent methyltransferase [Rhodothermales bacterium]